MQAMVIPREEVCMGWLGDGVFCVFDIFSMYISIKGEALVNCNLTVEGIVSIDRDDERV